MLAEEVAEMQHQRWACMGRKNYSVKSVCLKHLSVRPVVVDERP